MVSCYVTLTYIKGELDHFCSQEAVVLSANLLLSRYVRWWTCLVFCSPHKLRSSLCAVSWQLAWVFATTCVLKNLGVFLFRDRSLCDSQSQMCVCVWFFVWLFVVIFCTQRHGTGHSVHENKLGKFCSCLWLIWCHLPLINVHRCNWHVSAFWYASLY